MYFTSDMEKVIEQVNRTKDLGVIIEDTGSFNSHIEKVCKKSKTKMRLDNEDILYKKPSFLKIHVEYICAATHKLLQPAVVSS